MIEDLCKLQRQHIEQITRDAIKKCGYPEPEVIEIKREKNKDYDFSTNVCFKIAKMINESPKHIATQILKMMKIKC